MSDRTVLVLVRHGEANVNADPGAHPECTGLTETGLAQAARLAERLATEAENGRTYDAAYHSPRARCAATAAVLCSGLKLSSVADDDLRSADRDERVNIWDAQSNAIGTYPRFEPAMAPVAGAETWQHYLDRTGRALLRIAHRHQGQRVLITAHSETTAAAMYTFLRMPPGASRWASTRVSFTGITVWYHQRTGLPGEDPDGTWCLARANDDRHLRPATTGPAAPGAATPP